MVHSTSAAEIAPQLQSNYAAWRQELRAMLALAWPLVLTTLAQMTITATDVVFIGRLGSQALAAATLATNLYHLVMLFALGLLAAASPMIASELGKNRYSVHNVRQIVRQGLWTAIIIFIPCAFILWFGEIFLLTIGEPAELAALAGDYLRVFLWGLLPFLGFLVLRSFMSGLERPHWALVSALVGIIFNAAANWVLVFGHLGFPAMGMTGSGIASLLSNVLLFAIMALVVLRDRRFRRYQLFGKLWQADWPRFRAFWQLGIPIAALSTFEVGIFNAAAFMMGWLGEAELAAHAVAIQLAGMSFMVALGLSQAITVRVGRAYGAGDKAGVMRAGWVGIGLGLAAMLITALLMILIPAALIGVFLDIHDPANACAVELAVGFLAVAALFQLADGSQVLGIAALRGLHDTRVPMIYAVIGYWVIGFPLCIYLGFGSGLRQDDWQGILTVVLFGLVMLAIARWLKGRKMGVLSLIIIVIWSISAPASIYLRTGTGFGLGGVGVWLGLAAGLFFVAVLMLIRWHHREKLGLLKRLPIS